jgi:L-aminopeptidase/D-esterase-like protein
MIARIGAIAADCTARAIARGVYEADPAGGKHSWREVYR